MAKIVLLIGEFSTWDRIWNALRLLIWLIFLFICVHYYLDVLHEGQQPDIQGEDVQLHKTQMVKIERNIAWNEMVDSLNQADGELRGVEVFMREHEHDYRLNIIDLPTIKHLDTAANRYKQTLDRLKKLRRLLVRQEAERVQL